MKSKNLILAAVAFVFALGTAFSTSLLTNVPTYILTQADEESSFVCTNMGNLCEDAQEGNPCTITVLTTKPTPDADETVAGRKLVSGSCNVQLKGSNIDLSETISFYDVQ